MTHVCQAHVRQTEKAFQWAESYAQKASLQAAAMEQQDAAGDDDGPLFEDAEQPEPAAETSQVAPGHEAIIDVPPASAVADMHDLLKDSPPASPRHDKQQATAKRSAAAILPRGATVSMASLQRVPRPLKKKKKCAPGCTETHEMDANSDNDVHKVYSIDRIIGGSRVEAGAAPSYRVSWVGYADTNWQSLECPPPVDEDEDYMGQPIQACGWATQGRGGGRTHPMHPPHRTLLCL